VNGRLKILNQKGGFMAKAGKEKSPFGKVHHVGVVVENMDKALAHYESLGMGPFEPLKLSPSEGLLRGKRVISTPIISMGTVGGIVIELLQPTREDSLVKEFYESKGEGIHHVAFLVDDIDKETERLVKKGFKVLFSQKFGEGGCAFFDTRQDGGMLVELFRPPA
jgi:methylmalonyl-CoA/ethylmalonyl-CoA epimerase